MSYYKCSTPQVDNDASNRISVVFQLCKLQRTCSKVRWLNVKVFNWKCLTGIQAEELASGIITDIFNNFE